MNLLQLIRVENSYSPPTAFHLHLFDVNDQEKGFKTLQDCENTGQFTENTRLQLINTNDTSPQYISQAMFLP